VGRAGAAVVAGSRVKRLVSRRPLRGMHPPWLAGDTFFSVFHNAYPKIGRRARPWLPHTDALSPTIGKLKVFSGRPTCARGEDRQLPQRIARQITLANFPDGEISVRIDEDPRPRHLHRPADLPARE